MSWKLRIKKHVASALQHAGIFQVFNTLSKTKNRVFVLMYHRVLPVVHEEESFVQPGMYVSLKAFKRQMAFLKSSYQVLPLLELVQRLESGKSVGGCCAITFDDGWCDNYIHAFPVLKEFDVPATIFLATNFVGSNRWFWPEEVAFYLQRLAAVGLNFNHSTLVFPRNDREATIAEKIDRTIIALKNLTPSKRQEILVDLRTQCPASIPPRALLMKWEEVQEMSNRGLIDFGAHTHNHVILDHVPLVQAELEIRLSRLELEERLGRRPLLFAYPNGNFTDELQELVRRQGFKGAVSIKKGWAREHGDLFALPRIGIHEDISNTLPLFQARILCRGF